MPGRSIILLLCLSAIINLVNSEIIPPGAATDDTVKSLDPINFEQALPVTLFEVRESEKTILQPLLGRANAEVLNGRLTCQTKFYCEDRGKQLFMCPSSHAQTNDQCLAPKEFKDSQPLECGTEPVLTMSNTEQSCGLGGADTALSLGYKICPTEEQNTYSDTFYEIYGLCYNKNSKKVISVNYKLSAILQDKLFTREREIPLQMNTEGYGYINSDYYTNLEAEIKEKPLYKLRKLVPTEDMALATSRKSTEYFANFTLQHKDATDLWHEIGGYFRDHVTEWCYFQFVKKTGVFDLPENEITIPKDQKANIWITTLVNFSAEPDGEGLAILMNNFKDTGTETSNKQYIDTLCGDDLALDSLKEKFRKTGIQGRACKLTKEIYRLFVDDPQYEAVGILFVENITVKRK